MCRRINLRQQLANEILEPPGVRPTRHEHLWLRFDINFIDIYQPDRKAAILCGKKKKRKNFIITQIQNSDENFIRWIPFLLLASFPAFISFYEERHLHVDRITPEYLSSYPDACKNFSSSRRRSAGKHRALSLHVWRVVGLLDVSCV